MLNSLFNAINSSGLVQDNQYFEAYRNIIECNKDTQPVKFKTQRHHIIPAHFTTYFTFDNDVNIDARVNLSFKDHILAHYYLALCGATAEIRYSNELAVLRMIGYSELSLEDKKRIQDLDKYSIIYEEACKINSEKHKGKKPWNYNLHYTVGPMKQSRKDNISKKARQEFC